MNKILIIARFSWPYLKPYWGRASLGLVLGILFGVSNAGVLWLTKTMLTRLEPKVESAVPAVTQSAPTDSPATPDVLETLSPETSSWLKKTSNSISQGVARAVDPWLPTWGRPIDRYQVIGILIFLPLLVALRSAANYLSTYCMNWTGQHIINDLRVKVLDNLSKLSIDYFNRSTLGDMVTRINGDTKTLKRCLTNGIDHIVKDPITILSVFTWLLLIDWQLTVSSIILLPLCLIPVLILGRMARRASRKMRKIDVIQASMVIEILSGIRVVKAFCLEKEMVSRFRKLSRSLVGQTMRAIRATEMTGPIIETVSIFGVGAIILFVAFTDRNIPDLVTFFLGLIMFYDPVKKLAKLHLLIERTSVGIERLMNILVERPSVKESTNPVRLDSFQKEITLENLTFSYGHTPVLKNVSLSIPRGTMLGIAGESGSGKSTLVNLLFRFFDPTEGTIRIDGHDLKDIATDDLRQLMALVSQDVVVFDQTVHENIACGKKSATKEEVEAAAHAAFAHEFITQLPEGYETRLGERGTILSGGQRQRISIARAFIRNAPILILDEATAALDSQSEAEVQKALDNLTEHRTVISIAHRLATLAKSDNLMVLAQGKITEQGTFSDLLKAGGNFSAMAEKQHLSLHHPMNRKQPKSAKWNFLVALSCLLLVVLAALLVVPDLLVQWDIKREANKWKKRVSKMAEEDAPIHAPQLVELSLQSTTTLLPSRIREDLALTRDKSPYLVANRTTISAKASLTVPAGVEIWFGPKAQLVAFGRLTMTGTSEQPVRLVPAQTNTTWAGVFIGGGRPSRWPLSLPSRLTSPWTSHFSHVHFDTAIYGVKAVHASVRMENVVTRNVRELYSGESCDSLLREARFFYEEYQTTGNVNLFKFQYGSMWVENCQIQCPQTDKKLDAFDIDTIRQGHFIGNRIYGSPLPGTDGIDIGLGSKKVYVADNMIMSFSDKAISVGENAQAIITNNVLAYCGMGIGIKDSSQAQLIHNTFYRNKVGVACYEKNPGQGGGHASVSGCIFVGHTSQAVSSDKLSSLTVSSSVCDKEALAGQNNLQIPLQLQDPANLNFRVHPNSQLPPGPRVGASF